MNGGNPGSTHELRGADSLSYLPSGDPGPGGGGTYTNRPTDPTVKDYENIFGPSARDIKDDLQKYKRHGRWHLPDVLKGPNPWLTDRVDGLITDATNSPFTSVILPYRYIDNVDGKIKWNVWSFDEGLASRVPYEAAARTLTQSKRSYAGYAVRHGLAINLEHNFMMTPKGRENFNNQLLQLIGSIQMSNDLDVHMALILAPSYEKTMREKYYSNGKTPGQICRDYVDLFGFLQKNSNGLDILIEEAKSRLRSWNGPMPDFMLSNAKLGFQLQMTPERTNYLTQGPDGVRRLKEGPELSSYRGIKIINTRAFSMETGQAPRDMLRRRVRVAEYYRITPDANNHKREFEFYDESRDNWFTLSFRDLLKMALMPPVAAGGADTYSEFNLTLLREAFDHYYDVPPAAAPAPGHGHVRGRGNPKVWEAEDDYRGESYGHEGEETDYDSRRFQSQFAQFKSTRQTVSGLSADYPSYSKLGQRVGSKRPLDLGGNMMRFLGALSDERKQKFSMNFVHNFARMLTIINSMIDASPPTVRDVLFSLQERFDSVTPVIFGPLVDNIVVNIPRIIVFCLGAFGGILRHIYRGSLFIKSITYFQRMFPRLPDGTASYLAKSLNFYPCIDLAVESLGNYDFSRLSKLVYNRKFDFHDSQCIAVRLFSRYATAVSSRKNEDSRLHRRSISGVSEGDFFDMASLGAFLDPNNLNHFTIDPDYSCSTWCLFIPFEICTFFYYIIVNELGDKMFVYDYLKDNQFISELFRIYIKHFTAGITKFEFSCKVWEEFLANPKIQSLYKQLNKHCIDNQDKSFVLPSWSLVGGGAINTHDDLCHPNHELKDMYEEVFGDKHKPFFSLRLTIERMKQISSFITSNKIPSVREYSLITDVDVKISTDFIQSMSSTTYPADDIFGEYLGRRLFSDNYDINKTPQYVNLAARSVDTKPGVQPPDLTLNCSTLDTFFTTAIDRYQPRVYEEDVESFKKHHFMLTVEMFDSINAIDLRSLSGDTQIAGRGRGGGGPFKSFPPSTLRTQAVDEFITSLTSSEHSVARRHILQGNKTFEQYNQLFDGYVSVSDTASIRSYHAELRKIYEACKKIMTGSTDVRRQDFDNSYAEFQKITARGDQVIKAAAAAAAAAVAAAAEKRHHADSKGGKGKGSDGIEEEEGAGRRSEEEGAGGKRPEEDGGRRPEEDGVGREDEGEGDWHGGEERPEEPPPPGFGHADPIDRFDDLNATKEELRRAQDQCDKLIEVTAQLLDTKRQKVDNHNEILDHIEIVIIRPNIEHYMLGIILGMGGDGLGNTLWGQTELSVYDDSMHGVWGMSYKYHERAIVFNEKNLIRLWDIAYDGYTGGKDDTFVDWTHEDSVTKFKEDTMDVTKNYAGSSMMVLGFVHSDQVKDHTGHSVYRKHFQRNWPSPILFDDTFDPHHPDRQPVKATVGYDNLDVLDVTGFRVFNKPIYASYFYYRKHFPLFYELHMQRKGAGESTEELETTTDSLAFQGTMRIKEDGRLITEILGSGHHGPDYVGVASIRAGKGYKMVPGRPMLQHLV